MPTIFIKLKNPSIARNVKNSKKLYRVTTSIFTQIFKEVKGELEMRCYLHSEREVIGSCVNCGRLICEECTVEIEGKFVCKNCIQIKGSEKTRETSRPIKSRPKKTYTRNINHLDLSSEDYGEKIEKSAFILFLFTFFMPTGLNYLYLGLKKRAKFFVIIYFVGISIVTSALAITSQMMRSLDVTSLIFIFSSVTIVIFKIAVFKDTIKIMNKLSRGVIVKDTTRDLSNFIEDYKILIITILLCIHLAITSSIILDNPFRFLPFIVELSLVILLFVPSIIIVLGTYYLIFRSFFEIDCIAAQKTIKTTSTNNEKPSKTKKGIKEKSKNQKEKNALVPLENDLLNKLIEIVSKFDRKSESLQYTDIGTQVKKLAKTSNKMLSIIEENPSEIKRLNKFIEYYMPTTLKLLNEYEKFNFQENVKSKSVEDSLTKIESAINNTVSAFKNQLEMLFEEKSLDIDIEVNVLNDLLKREGLLED